MSNIRLVQMNVGASDEVLNAVIQEMIDSAVFNDPEITVAEWRIANWEILRAWARPPVGDYLDAQVKKKFKEKYATKGDEEEADYLDKAEAAKVRFPKPTV